jgi:hypothetical protein
MKTLAGAITRRSRMARALEMLTSRMDHAERERERAHLQNNIKAKLKQLKLSKTYSSMCP